jgi:hypothetical protein
MPFLCNGSRRKCRILSYLSIPFSKEKPNSVLGSNIVGDIVPFVFDLLNRSSYDLLHRMTIKTLKHFLNQF